MATTLDFIEYVIEQIQNPDYQTRYRKMFGDYCIYINEKPFILVCDNVVFVPKNRLLDKYNLDTGIPYDGARERYILDIENRELSQEIIKILEAVMPLPKKKKKKE